MKYILKRKLTNGGEGEGDGVLTDGESSEDCETSK